MSDSTLLFGLGQPGVRARLWSRAFAPDDSPSSINAWDERMSVEEGTIGFQRVPSGRSVVYFTKAGYLPDEFETIMPDDGGKDIRLTPEPLPRLTRIGNHRFITDDNNKVLLIGCSDFMLYWRFLQGEDIAPILTERQALGFNCVRVFGMAHYIPINEFSLPAFRPQDYGKAYYDNLLLFEALCHSFRQYVYFSCFPDNGFIMPNLSEKQTHHDSVVSRWTDLYELTNELDAHSFNYVNPADFTRPMHLLACAGSQGEGLHIAHWDFFDFHPRRNYPSHIKDCNLADNPNYLAGYEGLIGEPDRYGWQGNPNAMQAFESAGSARGTALGIVFHSRRGVRSELFDEQTRECAKAFIAGLKG